MVEQKLVQQQLRMSMHKVKRSMSLTNCTSTSDLTHPLSTSPPRLLFNQFRSIVQPYQQAGPLTYVQTSLCITD